MFEKLERLGKSAVVLAASVVSFAAAAAENAASEITVDLKLDGADFIAGERIRGVVDVVNASPNTIGIGTHEAFTNFFRRVVTPLTNDVGKVVGMETNRVPDRASAGSFTMEDRFFVEIYRASDMQQLSRTARRQFVADFYLKTGEGQKLEVFLGDHYDLREPSRYLAKPVFVRRGVRYEGMVRAFDVVDGVKVASAMQMFKRRPGLERHFALVYWSRNHSEHLFLAADDSGTSKRRWETRDLGPILRIDRPSISILPTGEVVVLHRLNQDKFVRTEFWSLPDDFEFRLREAVSDPQTAGTSRVRELYKEGGVKAKTNPWWKFW